MSIALYVGSSADRALEQLLVEFGKPVTRVTADDLGDLAQPGAAQPEAVVLDLRRDRRIPPAVALLRSHHPTTPMLVLAAALDPPLMLEAMRAGVNECLAEPIQRMEFGATLRRMLEQHAAAAAGSVYAFIGAKGGVGSTTLAVNVAASVSQAVNAKRKDEEAHSKTLLIDLHLMYGDCALFLGNEPRFSIVDAFEHTHRFDAAFLRGLVSRHPGGPDILASSNRLLPGSTDLHRIETLVELARQQYQYTFLDLSRSNGAVLDALSPVTTIVIVVNQDVATLRTANAIASVLRQRYGQRKVQFVLSRYDSQSEITKADVDDAVGEAVAFVIPSEYRTAVQAVNSGIPVVLGWPGKLAQAFNAFAGQLTGAAVPVAKATHTSQAWPLLSRLAVVRSFLS